MKASLPKPRAWRAERGFALIVVLLLLVVVTLLGIGASQISLLGEKGSRFERDQQVAFQSAEAALIDAEYDIRGPNASAKSRSATFSSNSALGFEVGCGTGASNKGLCQPAAEGQTPIWFSTDLSDTSRSVGFGDYTGRAFPDGSAGIRPAAKPRYVIEVLPDVTPGTNSAKPKFMYRVTAIGYGPRVETTAVLQMIFRKE